jgi:hypothetical protein
MPEICCPTFGCSLKEKFWDRRRKEKRIMLTRITRLGTAKGSSPKWLQQREKCKKRKPDNNFIPAIATIATVARQFCVAAMMLVAPSPSHHEEEQEADSTLSEVEETTDEPKTKRKSKVMKKILKAISFHVPILSPLLSSSPLPPFPPCADSLIFFDRKRCFPFFLQMN